MVVFFFQFFGTNQVNSFIQISLSLGLFCRYRQISLRFRSVAWLSVVKYFITKLRKQHGANAPLKHQNKHIQNGLLDKR